MAAAADARAAAVRATTTDVIADVAWKGWATSEALRFGPPPDQVACGALLLGVTLGIGALVPATRRWLEGAVFGSKASAFAWASAMAAALLSLAYVAHILRGGPRIVDATTYLLQARTLATGHFSFPAGFPSAATRGRFLLYDETHGTLSGLFPPGYPLVLSLGVHLGAPLAIGPLLAAGLALATRALGVHVGRGLGHSELSSERIGRAAALFSIACAVLRYHTADTMAHGVSALYTTLALGSAFAFRALRTDGSRRDDRLGRRLLGRAVLVGLALGGLIATRPVSTFAPALSCIYLMFLGKTERGPDPRTVARSLVAIAIAALPGVALLLVWQSAVTGHALRAPQLVYYATSDGPPGCFRYGFGAEIGCLFEHGDFVRHNLPHGYGAFAALGTTARRLKMHLADAGNLEVFAGLVLVGLFRTRTSVPGRALALAVATQIVAYAPFYFDGNFPGGGARFFAEVLPVEHVLIVLAIAPAAMPTGVPERPSRAPFAARIFCALALALFGFAVHTSYAHLALANREGGAPFFVPDTLEHANVASGLVFVDTDHGFSLGHVPFSDPQKPTGPRVVRLRQDDHDWLVFDAAGRPPTYRYAFEGGASKVAPWAPPPPDGTMRFEGEADWPPLAQDAGYAIPTFHPDASGGRALSLVPTGTGRASVDVAVPTPSGGAFLVVARVRGDPSVRGLVRIAGAEVAFIGNGVFSDLPALRVDLPRGESRLRLETVGGAAALDRVLLTAASPELSGRPEESHGTSGP